MKVCIKKQSTFYGDSRIKLVDGLLDVFDSIICDRSPTWISLEAPSGWGKTRVVQEFYASIAARQKSEYWPSSIVDMTKENLFDVTYRRKRVYPDPRHFSRESYSLPEFMWWGIACDMRNGNPIDVLLEDLNQIEAHRPYLALAWAALSSIQKKYIPSISEAKKIAAEIAIEGFSALNLVPAAGIILKLSKWFFDKDRVRSKSREMLYKAGKIEMDEKTLIDGIAAEFTKLAISGLPVIVFVEDLHKSSKYNDEEASPVEQLIEKLLAQSSCIMIITTTLPGEIERMNLASCLLNNHQYENKIHRIKHNEPTPTAFPNNASLQELSVEVMRSIIHTYYPMADPVTVDNLSKRYNNPLALELVCCLPKYVQRFSRGDLKLSCSEINALPEKVADLYRELWNDLPLSAQNTLALCTLAIPSNDVIWNKTLFSEVSTILDKQYVDRNRIPLMSLSEIPHSWIRIVNEFDKVANEYNSPVLTDNSKDLLMSFNEPDQLSIAKEKRESLFFEDQIEMFRNALADQIRLIEAVNYIEDAVNLNMARLAQTLHIGGWIDDVVGRRFTDQLHKYEFVLYAINAGIDVIRDFDSMDGDVLDMKSFEIENKANLSKQSTESYIWAEGMAGGTIIGVDLLGSGNRKNVKRLVALEGVYDVSIRDWLNRGAIKLHS